MTAPERRLIKEAGNPVNAAEGTKMAIRKYGAATGEVTGVDQGEMAREAALRPEWDEGDDQALEAENLAADQGNG